MKKLKKFKKLRNFFLTFVVNYAHARIATTNLIRKNQNFLI